MLWALLAWSGALGLGPSALHAQASRGSDPALSSETRTAIVEGISQALVSTYIYEDLARDMATLLQERLRVGAYEGIDDGVELKSPTIIAGNSDGNCANRFNIILVLSS